jgi:hypothetical protein
MVVNRTELLKILASLKPGLAKKEMVEQATHFIFTGDDVVTYNDQICISHPYLSGIKFSVKGEEFYKCLEVAQGDDVDLILQENKLSIKAKKTKASLSLVLDDRDRVESHISKMKATMSDWVPLPSDFLYALSLCSFSASRDLSTGILACVMITNNKVFATDRNRVSRFTLEQSLNNTFFLFARDVLELLKLPVTEFCIPEGWVHFKTKDDVTFSCRTISGSLPNLNNFFNVEGPTIKLPDDLKESVDAVIFMTKGDSESSRFIEVAITEGKLTVKGEKERGWIEKMVNIDYKDEPITFRINPNFLSQILERSANITVGRKAVYFNTEKFEHVIALVLMETA